MTPLKIHVLLEIYALAGLYDAHWTLHAMKHKLGVIRELKNQGLIIEVYADPGEMPYKTTARGDVYVTRLTSVPPPDPKEEPLPYPKETPP